MRIAVIGPAQDIHLRRWGEALRAVGAEVLFVGIEPAPEELEPYLCVGEPVKTPRLSDFLWRRQALRKLLQAERIDLAHPIHLTPSALWVWSSGFRPYVPFAMGADVLEYTPNAPPLYRSWTLQSRSHSFSGYVAAWLRRRFLPTLLRQILQDSLLSVGDNYEICFSKKFFEKNKNIVELPTGIWLDEAPFPDVAKRRYLLAPRGATLLYQADVILHGYENYLRSGGKLPFVLLAGAYPPHPQIAQHAAHLKKSFYEMFFFFDKKIPKEKMLALWRETVAFVSAPVYDGYSYAVAEGRAYGALPIVNAIPSHMEILTHGYNAWFVEPFTPERLAEAFFTIETFLNDNPFWVSPNVEWITRFSDIVENARLFLRIVQELL